MRVLARKIGAQHGAVDALDDVLAVLLGRLGRAEVVRRRRPLGPPRHVLQVAAEGKRLAVGSAPGRKQRKKHEQDAPERVDEEDVHERG